MVYVYVFFGFLVFVAIVLSSLIFRDGKKLRRKGVDIYPGVYAGLALALMFLLPWFVFKLFGEVEFGSSKSINRMVFMVISFFAPIVLYALLSFLKFNKTAKLVNSPLLEAPRWTRWLFFLIIIFISILYFYIGN